MFEFFYTTFIEKKQKKDGTIYFIKYFMEDELRSLTARGQKGRFVRKSNIQFQCCTPNTPVLSRVLGFPISFMDGNLLNGELKLVIPSYLKWNAAFPTLSNMLNDILSRDMVVKTSKVILSFYAVCNGIGLGCPGLDNRASMLLFCIYNPLTTIFYTSFQMYEIRVLFLIQLKVGFQLIIWLLVCLS